MKTILLALGRRISVDGTAVTIPAELLPVAGRPLVQRFVERLSDSGRKEIVVVLHADPERFSSFLEDGERWGADISYYRCGPEDEPATFAAALCARLDAEGVVDPLAPLPIPMDEASRAERYFPGALNLSAYLESVAAVLSGSLPGYVPSGREVSPGIRLSHHVRIHPSAKLVAPVYIGEGAEIGANAVVGPFASVEPGSIVGKDTTMKRSVLLPWTIVGESLSLEGVVVEGSTFFKPETNATYVSGDPALSTARRKR